MLKPAKSRYFTLGGITTVVSADLPIQDSTFRDNIRQFETEYSEADRIFLHHQFTILPEPSNTSSIRLYHKAPWEIYREGQQFVYLHYAGNEFPPVPFLTARFSEDHSSGIISHRSSDTFLEGNLHSITLFPTDQILFSRVLANRQGCIIHSAGMVLDKRGLLFVGHSGAGKSTICQLLQHEGQILCDDRNIVRKVEGNWRLYGTWSHGDIPTVSPASASLLAVIFLEQAEETKLVPIEDRREIVRLLPFYIIKPLVTADWWEKTFDLIGQIAREVPVYRLRFEKSERVIDALQPLKSLS